MNYEKSYENIIKIAQSKNRFKKPYTNTKYEYYENHHIIPDCIGGPNDKNNMVLLTAREHFTVHLLLSKIYPNTRGLQHAVSKMKGAFIAKGLMKPHDILFVSTMYEEARKRHALAVSAKHTGMKRSQITKDRQSAAKQKFIKEHGTEAFGKGAKYAYNTSTKEIKRVDATFVIEHPWARGTGKRGKGKGMSSTAKNIIAKSRKNKIDITNGIAQHRISPAQLIYFDGWEIGKINSMLLIANNGIVNKRMTQIEISKSNEFVNGKLYMGRLVINNGKMELKIEPENLHMYIGFIKGRLL